MLKDLDFSHLEFVSAVKNISAIDNMRLVLCTITFLDKKDSISHLTGVDAAFARNELEQEGKYIKLSASYVTFNGSICEDESIKAVFTDVNNKYRNLSWGEDDENLESVLKDVEFVEQVFERSNDKFVYM